ncbi:lytic transglycosylase domain-containing protein [Hoeflea sp. G2-23]|uniref:Lytic transglycosylase domain-containing protein n=1 Tax=Hoeflea algicola TaxID=2983763 RepID=A0ABT3Z7X8_9HYPH|nr:lytic transglycosylase domain-containing protein [Hoeflea algicola]MCY0147883.1 lytic transglycosylase domain-containing protein [Hoeflea algicola]
MRSILTAASAALLTLVLAGCTTSSAESKSEIKESSLSFGYSGRPYNALISSYAKSYGVPLSLAHAVISVESNYRPKARGAAGEIGLMQIKPATARMMGYSGSAKGLYKPENNIKYGMKYLAKAHQLGGGTTCGTILKYNAGHAAKRMNPVSKRYCGKVQLLMK